MDISHTTATPATTATTSLTPFVAGVNRPCNPIFTAFASHLADHCDKSCGLSHWSLPRPFRKLRRRLRAKKVRRICQIFPRKMQPRPTAQRFPNLPCISPRHTHTTCQAHALGPSLAILLVRNCPEFLKNPRTCFAHQRHYYGKVHVPISSPPARRPQQDNGNRPRLVETSTWMCSSDVCPAAVLRRSSDNLLSLPAVRTASRFRIWIGGVAKAHGGRTGNRLDDATSRASQNEDCKNELTPNGDTEWPAIL